MRREGLFAKLRELLRKPSGISDLILPAAQLFSAGRNH
jgi:hypothetical protein